MLLNRNRHKDPKALSDQTAAFQLLQLFTTMGTRVFAGKSQENKLRGWWFGAVRLSVLHSLVIRTHQTEPPGERGVTKRCEGSGGACAVQNAWEIHCKHPLRCNEPNLFFPRRLLWIAEKSKACSHAIFCNFQVSFSCFRS